MQNILARDYPLGFNYTNIATSAQTLVSSGPGILRGVAFNSNNVSAGTIYDNTVSGGTVIASFPASAMTAPIFLGPLDVLFNNGLVVSTGSGNTNLTIMYGPQITP